MHAGVRGAAQDGGQRADILPLEEEVQGMGVGEGAAT